MKIKPDTREEWQSIVKTSIKGGALVIDKLFTGGALSFLVNIGIEKRSSEALNELKEISSKLKEEIKSKIDLDYIKSDEFMIFISDAMSEALKVKNIEKIAYFRSAIISGMMRDVVSSKKLLFIDALSSLSVDMLILLKLIHDMSFNQQKLRFNFVQIQKQFDSERNLLMAELKALERCNLVDILLPSGAQSYENSLIIYGNFGKDFIHFIMKYSGES